MTIVDRLACRKQHFCYLTLYIPTYIVQAFEPINQINITLLKYLRLVRVLELHLISFILFEIILK